MITFVMLAVTVLSIADYPTTIHTLQLSEGEPPYNSPYAYYMSVGPHRPAPPPDTTADDGLEFLMRTTSYNLRVTLYNCERSWWMTIEEIATKRADTRVVVAEYHLDLTTIGSPLLPRRMEVFWLSPMSFAWTTKRDTVVVEHKGASEFQVTVRPVKN